MSPKRVMNVPRLRSSRKCSSVRFAIAAFAGPVIGGLYGWWRAQSSKPQPGSPTNSTGVPRVTASQGRSATYAVASDTAALTSPRPRLRWPSGWKAVRMD